MRFVLECKICSRVIKEITDETYTKFGAFKKLIVCEQCKKNLEKLGEEKEDD
jgi:hypothetical protein